MSIANDARFHFLAEWRVRPWKLEGEELGIRPVSFYLPDDDAVRLEVDFAVAPGGRPTLQQVERVWRKRHGRRATDLLLVVAYERGGGGASSRSSAAVLAGLQDDADFSKIGDVLLSRVEDVVRRALEGHSQAAIREDLTRLLTPSDDLVPGVRNEGLFASHALKLWPEHNKPATAAAAAHVSSLRGTSGRDLFAALGWTLRTQGETEFLYAGINPRAVGVALMGEESFDRHSRRFGAASTPVAHALAIAQVHKLDWVVAVHGRRTRLYAARSELGIQRRGTTDYVELDVATLATATDETAAYPWLLLSKDALDEGGTAYQIHRDSQEHATALGARLRERVYVNIVPKLSEVIARRLGGTSQSALDAAYHDTMIVLFRLLFVAYAEERGVLPYETKAAYQDVSLKRLAQQFAEDDHLWNAERTGLAERSFDEHATNLWSTQLQIWHAVFDGNSDWGVPAYGGELFDTTTPTGRRIEGLNLTNAEIGPALASLLVDTSPSDHEIGPVDFRDLSVREFGTIYEGLLESSLSVADHDLTLNAKKTYVPVKVDKHGNPTSPVVVRDGEIYFHNASGQRKATGSYFTKTFAVEHLLTQALDPTVKEHLADVKRLLDADREADAASRFFDFHVADIAMGSGHFLTGAIDHIATQFGAFLTNHPIAGVAGKLEALRTAATKSLETVGVDPHDVQIGDDHLLRRQVARRCIYGVDVNDIAVDLARLATWIHTFVPGLPMTSLDHNLVCGNSLTGIGTVDELLDVLDHRSAGKKRAAPPQGASLFTDEIQAVLTAANEPLAHAAALAEATPAQTRTIIGFRKDAAQALEPLRAACDVATAARLDVPQATGALTDWHTIVKAGASAAVRDALAPVAPLHFPVAFPEVFRPGRTRPGFDVILGNPPWEKVKVEEHGWWGLRFPGLRSLPQQQKNALIRRLRRERPDLLRAYTADVASAQAQRDVLKSSPYPLGNGDTDLHKVFCWRNWALLREGGRSGTVYPRGALSGSGTTEWRHTILTQGSFDDVCFLVNTRQWIFEDVHPQYTIGLTTIHRGAPHLVRFRGPYHSLAAYEAGSKSAPVETDAPTFATWSTGNAFPLLPSAEAAGVFEKMRQHPRFDSAEGFEFRPVRELETYADRNLMDFNVVRRSERSRIPILKGASFDIWNPSLLIIYATVDLNKLADHLTKKVRRQANNSRSAFYHSDEALLRALPMLRARIAFRDVTRATDSRTVRAALLPPLVSFTEKAPYLLRRMGDERDESFVLGMMSSIPFDWFARRYIELKLGIELLDSLPLPRPPHDDPWRRRVVVIAGRLAAVDHRYDEWARAVGVPVGSVSRDESDPQRRSLIAELDALSALLYGLSEGDVELIFRTFHRGWAYQERLDAVLEQYRRHAHDREAAKA